jgi:hypothetical protein
MAYLLIHGNTNEYTFANTIIAANEKSKELFFKPLEKIFVIHSPDSAKKINGEWENHVKNNGIDLFEIHHKTIPLDNLNDENILKFVSHIEFLFNGLGVENSNNWIVDLTNGTSIQKNLMSNLSYILNLQHQYMVNIAVLRTLTPELKFLTPQIMQQCYESAPDCTLLDKFAYLDLSEVIRYKNIIDDQTAKFISITNGGADELFFKGNLLQSIELKLKGDNRKDNSIYRIATASISSSIEELITTLANKIENVNEKTLGSKIRIIASNIERKDILDFDFEFFQKLNEFMLYLRNSTVHKSKKISDLEKFKAELAMKMAFPYMEFYITFIAPNIQSVDENSSPIRIAEIPTDLIDPSEVYYYGIDGDNTGNAIEALFMAGQISEAQLKEKSGSISGAIHRIVNKVKTYNGTIIFQAGDDLFFKGNMTGEQLNEFKTIYNDHTKGNTCSIGFGKTIYETYLAMKLAKSRPGKNKIIGIRLN